MEWLGDDLMIVLTAQAMPVSGAGRVRSSRAEAGHISQEVKVRICANDPVASGFHRVRGVERIPRGQARRSHEIAGARDDCPIGRHKLKEQLVHRSPQAA